MTSREVLSKLARLYSAHFKQAQRPHLDKKWKRLLQEEPKKLFDANGEINWANLAAFRRLSIFVSDMSPRNNYLSRSPRYWMDNLRAEPVRGVLNVLRQYLSGYARGERQMLIDCLEGLKAEGALDLLARYPVRGTPGEPNTLEYDGYSFNLRWLRHVYFVNLFRKLIKPQLGAERFVNIDIGCSYATFSYLLKSEHPNSSHILVDFPEQLILAYFYLSNLFPEAKIATVLDFENRTIDRAFVESFDFILVPVDDYERIQAGAADMMTNFFSFGEMRREWFQRYLDSALFKSIRWLFTSNRVVSAPRGEPTYDTDLCVLDYPLNDFKRVLFDIFPIYKYYVRRRHFFFWEKVMYSSPNFDFIGYRDPVASPQERQS